MTYTKYQLPLSDYQLRRVKQAHKAGKEVHLNINQRNPKREVGLTESQIKKLES